MAITNTCVRFLCWAKRRGVSFASTLTLGHLENRVKKEVIDNIIEKEKSLFDKEKINWDEKFADSIFYALGADSLESLDYCSYEKADIIHDLNIPISETLHNKYTAIIDGGTLEHIFNFPQAIKTCMQCLKLNGHFIGFSPTNNLMGHGFYQFSPELFYQVFSSQNGFRIIGMFIIAADFELDTEKWYEVVNPEDVKERVTLRNKFPCYLMILAQKVQEKEELKNILQSDYSELWAQKQPHDIKESKKRKKSLFKKIYRKILPSTKEENLEKINPFFFRKKTP